jgi:hypothetical protein
MSGYRIDPAVVHPKKTNRYILVIDCDEAMYHSSPKAKERIIFCQNFLENRKWKFTRI